MNKTQKAYQMIIKNGKVNIDELKSELNIKSDSEVYDTMWELEYHGMVYETEGYNWELAE